MCQVPPFQFPSVPSVWPVTGAVAPVEIPPDGATADEEPSGGTLPLLMKGREEVDGTEGVTTGGEVTLGWGSSLCWTGWVWRTVLAASPGGDPGMGRVLVITAGFVSVLISLLFLATFGL